MFITLNQDQIEQYERDGVLFPIPVLSAAEIAGFRSALEAVEAQRGGVLKRLDNAHLFFRWAYRLATHPAVVDAVAAVLSTRPRSSLTSPARSVPPPRPFPRRGEGELRSPLPLGEGQGEGGFNLRRRRHPGPLPAGEGEDLEALPPCGGGLGGGWETARRSEATGSGDEILIDGTLILCKDPGDTGYVSWHQDSVYSGWHLTPSTSAWIALSPSTPESGCLRVIPGSHTRGLLDHVEMPDGDNLLRRGERISADVDESEASDIVLQPGEMSLHHSNIIHGSNPNRSDARRVGFIVRFVTSRVGDRETPLVRVRGSSDGRHLNLATEPDESSPAEGLAAWEEFNRRRRVKA